MAKSLKNRLMPLLDEARAIVEMSQGGYQCTPERQSQYDDALCAMIKTLFADSRATARKHGKKPNVTVMPEKAGYDYVPEPLNDLHHMIYITISEVLEIDSRRALSHTDPLVALRNIARRMNARLIEERIPLFVFLELA